mgnify:CR=1 FL=1
MIAASRPSFVSCRAEASRRLRVAYRTRCAFVVRLRRDDCCIKNASSAQAYRGAYVCHRQRGVHLGHWRRSPRPPEHRRPSATDACGVRFVSPALHQGLGRLLPLGSNLGYEQARGSAGGSLGLAAHGLSHVAQILERCTRGAGGSSVSSVTARRPTNSRRDKSPSCAMSCSRLWRAVASTRRPSRVRARLAALFLVLGNSRRHSYAAFWRLQTKATSTHGARAPVASWAMATRVTAPSPSSSRACWESRPTPLRVAGGAPCSSRAKVPYPLRPAQLQLRLSAAPK